MNIDREFLATNEAARERLLQIMEPLTDEQMRRSVGHGWTIASSLGHLAFWENWLLVHLDRFHERGITRLTSDADAMNDAMLPLLQQVPPDAIAGQLAWAMGEVDHRLAELTDEQLEAIGFDGSYINLYRSVHRNEHAAEILSALE
jgi:hypothetical protein